MFETEGEAAAENIALSSAERAMLAWSESDPEVPSDPSVAERLSEEMSDEEYELKIAGLIERSYKSDPSLQPLFRQARASLSKGDHYLLVIVDQALAKKLKRGWL